MQSTSSWNLMMTARKLETAMYSDCGDLIFSWGFDTNVKSSAAKLHHDIFPFYVEMKTQRGNNEPMMSGGTVAK